jgi:hypothetical protein
VAQVLAEMGRLDSEYQTAVTLAEAAIAAVPADPRNREILGEIEMGIASTEGKIATRTGQAPGARKHHDGSCRAYVRAARVLGALVSDGIATPKETQFAKDAEVAAAACGAR